ncbi:MAG: biotin--[acetyl-CoA-carboxylase] ligase, partial [Rhodospirillales bacterium]|nr:biotin--[acetyl-CoA-carboxylase] ligase [Rhodospirillales bacterium]
GGMSALRTAWLDKAHHLGDPLRVRVPGGDVEGNFKGLDENGALLLESGGRIARFEAGDVFFGPGA